MDGLDFSLSSEGSPLAYLVQVPAFQMMGMMLAL